MRHMKRGVLRPDRHAARLSRRAWSETLELVDRTSPYALTGAVFARDRAAIVEAHDRAARRGRQLLHQRQADRRGRRPAAVRRRARVGHRRQGRLAAEPPAVRRRADDQGDVRAADRLSLPVPRRRLKPRLIASRPAKQGRDVLTAKDPLRQTDGLFEQSHSRGIARLSASSGSHLPLATADLRSATMNRKLVAAVAVLWRRVRRSGFSRSSRSDGDAATAGAAPGARARSSSAPRSRTTADGTRRGGARRAGRSTRSRRPAPARGPGRRRRRHRASAAPRCGSTSVPPRTTKTEDDGTFAFDKLVGRTYSSCPRDTRDWSADRSRTSSTAASDPVVVRLAEGAACRGHRQRRSGKPIAGAEVKVAGTTSTRRRPTTEARRRSPRALRAGSAVRRPRPATRPGTRSRSVGDAGGTGTVAISCTRASRSPGRVVDEAGKPVAQGAHVRERAACWAGDRPASDVDHRRQGPVLVRRARAGHARSLASPTASTRRRKSTPVTVGGSRRSTGVEITMKAGGGRSPASSSTPTASRSPFATVRVAGERRPRCGARRVAPGDDRSARARSSCAASRARSCRRAPSPTPRRASSSTSISRRPPAQARFELVLDVSGTIAGIVVDETGQPVAEVQVNAFPDMLGGASPTASRSPACRRRPPTAPARSRSTACPTARIGCGPSRTSAASATGWGKQGTPAKTGDKDVKHRARRDRRAHRQDRARRLGAAPKLAYVQVGCQAATPAIARRVRSRGPRARHRTTCTSAAPSSPSSIKHDVKIEPGKTTDLGTITVDARPPAHRQGGRRERRAGRRRAGQDRPDAVLDRAAHDDDSRRTSTTCSGMRNATSDQDGSFVAHRRAAEGDHRDRRPSDRGPLARAARSRRARDDPPPVTLALRGYGSIVGKVTHEGPAAGRRHDHRRRQRAAARRRRSSQTDADGTFTLPKVPEGTHVLSAMQQMRHACR